MAEFLLAQCKEVQRAMHHPRSKQRQGTEISTRLAENVQWRMDELQREIAGLRLEVQRGAHARPLQRNAKIAAKVTSAEVRAIVSARRERNRCFPRDLFSDPAWDILLELHAAHMDQQRLSVSDVCVAAAVPGTTALRWMGILERNGLLIRRSDPLDGRRVFVQLSADGVAAMESYFSSTERLRVI